MEKALKVQATGMAWYRPEEFARVRKEMADGHVLHDTYDDWLKAAELGEARLTQQGMRVVRAEIKLDDFLTWCRSLNIRPDAQARMRWGNEAVIRQLRQERGQH